MWTFPQSGKNISPHVYLVVKLDRSGFDIFLVQLRDTQAECGQGGTSLEDKQFILENN